MRSGLIFAISEKISNRYMLCRMVAASARRMHRDGVSISQSINHSLQVLQHSSTEVNSLNVEAVAVPEKAPESETAALVP